MSRKARKFLFKTILILCIIALGAYWVFFFFSTGVTKNSDAYIYELPFEKGTQDKIVQGYGGLFSHSHAAALDFEMKEGTPVYSAREGEIFSYRDNYSQGGPFSKYKGKANYIIIKHSDGSYGCYWHLKKDGVEIKKGLVAKGQLIGYSGNTGFTLRPHLHFSVKVKFGYEEDAFIQTKFRTANGVELLKTRQTYKRPNE